MSAMPIFDGHNDVLLRLMRRGEHDAERRFVEGGAGGHLDLPRARAGGFAGGLFAIFPPDLPQPGARPADEAMEIPPYDLPLPPELPLDQARRSTLAMAALLIRLERASAGMVRICRSVAEIRAAMAGDAVAAVMHVEGAEAIDRDFHMLDVLHAAGLRSIGPVWSRPNIFAHGVPFRFPSGPDTGPGLTTAGRDLVRACNARRILIDLSHLNEAGFWEVAKLSDAPLVAGHSNAHAVCQHSRNLTDRQLAAIAESKGLVGVNFAVQFIRPDGRKEADTPLDALVDHVVHLVGHLGEDGVALGSDFDGALIPAAIGDVAGLPALVEALRRRGFTGESLEKICHRNWLRVLEATWGG